MAEYSGGKMKTNNLNFDMEKKFEWSDELVKEFFVYLNNHLFLGQESTDDVIKKFKTDRSIKYPEGILEFNFASHINHVKDIEVPYQEWCRRNFKDLNSTIHSVKNSSGDVLAVGMETNKGTIEAFGLVKNPSKYWIEVDIINSESQRMNYNAIEDNVHPATLKTEDGYEIKEGDTLYVVNHIFEIQFIQVFSNLHLIDFTKKHFKHIGNAEKYIEENKPRFSKKQILSAYTSLYNGNKDVVILPLKNLGL